MSHPTGYPTTAEETKDQILLLLTKEHTLPPDALAAAKSLREYASLAFTAETFVEHTNISLEDDPVQVLTSPPTPTCPSVPRSRNSPHRNPPRT
jgi:hypothetical protein